MKRCLCWPLVLLIAAGWPAKQAAAQSMPHYDHVVLVIDENKNDSEIRGSSLAPYINNVLIPGGADLTHFVAEQHPSQPNYLQLFSGSNQNVQTDDTSPLAPFTTPNLGRELLNAGETFATFSESLPSVGFTGDSYTTTPNLNEYVRKHNPAVNWQSDASGASANALPSTTNRPFTDFPATDSGFAGLPNFSIVVPNEQNDMHDGTITQGDNWLQTHIEPYRQWAITHNSLLIFTFDESDMGQAAADPNNQIITVVSGQNVLIGKYGEASIARFHLSNSASPDTAINHYNLLRTVEGVFGTATDASAVAQNNVAFNPTGGSILPITDIFATPEPSALTSLCFGAGLLALLVVRRRFLRHAKG